jgi:prepilin-type N-terminal cleavage/methylation domain-containing protein
MVLLKSLQLRKNEGNLPVFQHGFTLLETLISVTIFSIFLLFFLSSFTHIFASQDTSWKRVEASMLAQEGLEISYNIFTNTQDWTSLINRLHEEEVFHVTTEGTPDFVPGVEIGEDLNREIRVEDVYRSSETGEIVTTVSDPLTVYDPDTVLVKSRVEWVGKTGQEHIEYVTYVTRNEKQ